MKEETLVANLLRYRRVIEGMIAAMIGDASTAEDLFQEVAVILTRKREQAGEDARFVAWARAVAWNVVRDWRKKTARSKVRFVDDAALEGVARVFEEIDAPVWDARRRALEQCAQRLPPREREVLRRRYQGGEEIDAIASSLGASRGAVDTLLYRIRKALHACVQGKLA
jgi:RNA polymerase sigma-70 factor (ECF subfamily)